MKLWKRRWSRQKQSFRKWSIRTVCDDNGNNEEEWAAVAREDFELSEDTVSLLIGMGFTMDHALEAIESTRLNRMEFVM
jgi:hypothetical protein